MGEGNATRKISKAERVHDFINYKNEISLSYERFFTKCQNMYNIFEEEGNPTEEDSKICFIFKQVEHSDLHKSIGALKYQMETNPSGTVSYTK